MFSAAFSLNFNKNFINPEGNIANSVCYILGVTCEGLVMQEGGSGSSLSGVVYYFFVCIVRPPMKNWK